MLIRVFLDTSALFAAIFSAEGGGRMILKLGEAGVIDLMVSSQVLSELEKTMCAKAPHLLGVMALLIDRSTVRVVGSPTPEILQQSRTFVSHPGDAEVISAAWNTGVDYFITLDRKHFLDNAALRAAVPFPLGTPGDFLAWLRSKWSYIPYER